MKTADDKATFSNDVLCDACLACSQCSAHTTRCAFDQLGWQLSLQHLLDNGDPRVVACTRCRRASLLPGVMSDLRAAAAAGTLDVTDLGWQRLSVTVGRIEIPMMRLANADLVLNAQAVRRALKKTGAIHAAAALPTVMLPWSDTPEFVAISELLDNELLASDHVFRQWAQRLVDALAFDAIPLPAACVVLPKPAPMRRRRSRRQKNVDRHTP